MSTIQLTPEQHAVLTKPGVSAVRAVDPVDSKVYVLVEERTYQQLRQHLAGDDQAVDALYPLIAEVSPEDWEDASAYGIKRP
jgi:hypothetical protein